MHDLMALYLRIGDTFIIYDIVSFVIQQTIKIIKFKIVMQKEKILNKLLKNDRDFVVI